MTGLLLGHVILGAVWLVYRWSPERPTGFSCGDLALLDRRGHSTDQDQPDFERIP